MLDKTLISNIEKVFFVDNDPFPNAIINNFLPIEKFAQKSHRFPHFRYKNQWFEHFSKDFGDFFIKSNENIENSLLSTFSISKVRWSW